VAGIRITDDLWGSIHSVFAFETTTRSFYKGGLACPGEARTGHGKCYDEAEEIPSTPLSLAALRLKLRLRADVDIGQPGELRDSSDGGACVFFVPVSD
jgi:hypothetical protein